MRKVGFIASQAGLTLIELMVALVVGMLVAIASFSALFSFEGTRRITNSTSDITQSGDYAATVLDKAIRSAGAGVSGKYRNDIYGCKLAVQKSSTVLFPTTTAMDAPFDGVVTALSATGLRFAPVLILPNTSLSSTSDVLLVMAGMSGSSDFIREIDSSPGAVMTAASLPVKNSLGISANDLILFGQSSGSVTGARNCLLSQVSSKTATEVSLGGTYYTSAISGAVGVTDFSAGGFFANLGNTANPPQFFAYAVGPNRTLSSYDLLDTVWPRLNLVAEGVVMMKALYSVSPGNTWTTATGVYAPTSLASNAATIKSINAVKVGLVLRANLQEKTDVAPGSLSLFSDTGSAYSYTISASDQKYRHRTVEVTIPIRNNMFGG